MQIHRYRLISLLIDPYFLGTFSSQDSNAKEEFLPISSFFLIFLRRPYCRRRRGLLKVPDSAAGRTFLRPQ